MSEPELNLSIASDALALIELEELEGATVPDTALRLKLVRQVTEKAKRLQDALELTLAERMESNDVRVPGVGWVERRPKPYSTAGSDWDGAREAGRRAIVKMVSVDELTGEIRPDWVNVAHQAINLWTAAFSTAGPKAPFKTRLNLNQEDFIKLSPAGHTITIHPETEREQP